MKPIIVRKLLMLGFKPQTLKILSSNHQRHITEPKLVIIQWNSPWSKWPTVLLISKLNLQPLVESCDRATVFCVCDLITRITIVTLGFWPCSFSNSTCAIVLFTPLSSNYAVCWGGRKIEVECVYIQSWGQNINMSKKIVII